MDQTGERGRRPEQDSYHRKGRNMMNGIQQWQMGMKGDSQMAQW